MDTIRLTAADFLEKLETAVAERSVERMTAMEYAEKLIADKERDKTVFDNSQRNLIVNLLTSWMTGRQRKNLPTIWRLRLRLKTRKKSIA